MQERTVAAISTPLGEGGVGMIRISGTDAIQVADRCFKPFSGARLYELDGYRAAYGELFDSEGVFDDAVALVFRAPKSYTGENVVEITVHGGRAVTRRALRAVLDCGAEPAAAGEFTKRAFLNGKLDLAGAEAICELISAKNDSALKISRAAKEGRVSKEIEDITEMLISAAAKVAVLADYPDDDIPGFSENELAAELERSALKLSALLKNYDAGAVVREGIDCVIAGKPNVGKSTLMNYLCGKERSIVTDIAGTTRDIVENSVTIDGITLNLADTAGIRATDDIVESVGVDRAIQRLDTAALVLAVFDGSSRLDDDDRRLLDSIKDKNAIIIINKTDLPCAVSAEAFDGKDVLYLSAKDGFGMEGLSKAISQSCGLAHLDPDTAVLVSERQRNCTVRCLDLVNEALCLLNSGMTCDAAGVCIDDAISALLELTGKRVTNEVADEVFRSFCVGK